MSTTGLAKSFINLNTLDERGYTLASALSPKDVLSLLTFFDCHPHASNGGAFHSTMEQMDVNYKKMVDEKIKSLLNEQVELILPGHEILFGNFVMKEPGLNGSVGIHTDWSYVDESVHTSYNLWIPLTDVNEHNGCLHIWPGSQTFTPRIRTTPYVPFSDEEEQIIRFSSIPVPLSAGQGILYHGGLIHYSDPNITSESRPAIAVVIVPKGAQPMHYYRPKPYSLQVEAHQVNRSFFLTHQPQIRPTGTTLLNTTEVPMFSLSAEKILGADMTHDRVSTYYDEWTEAYRDIYGDVIQAFRPKDENELLCYIMNSAGLGDGQKIVDAGCGICGPAIHFAQNRAVHIEAITLSGVQANVAAQSIATAGLQERINCIQGDFRLMDSLVKNKVDGVIFLESLGHSTNAQMAILAAYKVLKSGGFIYIKDFFPRESANLEMQQRIDRTIENINREYNYSVLDLHQTLTYLRKAGFIIDFIKRLNFESDTQIRRTFESRHNISVFDGGEFMPAEWLEIRAIKYFDGDDR